MGTSDTLRKKHVVYVACAVVLLWGSVVRCPIVINDELVQACDQLPIVDSSGTKELASPLDTKSLSKPLK